MAGRAYPDDQSTVELKYPYEMTGQKQHPTWYDLLMQQLYEEQQQQGRGGRQGDGLEGYRGWGNVGKKAISAAFGIPAFQGGTDRYRGAAVVGEAGPEIVEGEFSVMPNWQTEEVLRSGAGMPGFQGGTLPVQLREKVPPQFDPRLRIPPPPDIQPQGGFPSTRPILQRPGPPPPSYTQQELQEHLSSGRPEPPPVSPLKRIISGLVQGVPAGLSGLSRVNSRRGRYGGGGGGGGAVGGFLRGYTDPTPLWSPGYYQKVKNYESQLADLQAQAEMERKQAAESRADENLQLNRERAGAYVGAQEALAENRRRMPTLDPTQEEEIARRRKIVVNDGNDPTKDPWQTWIYANKFPSNQAPPAISQAVLYEMAASGSDVQGAMKTLGKRAQETHERSGQPRPYAPPRPVRATYDQGQKEKVEAAAYRHLKKMGNNAKEAKRAVDRDDDIPVELKLLVKDRIDEVTQAAKGRRRGRPAASRDEEIDALIEGEELP